MTIIGWGLLRKHCLSYTALALSLFMYKHNSLHTWTVSASQWAVLIRWWLGFILVLVSFTLYRYEEMHAKKVSILIIFQFYCVYVLIYNKCLQFVNCATCTIFYHLSSLKSDQICIVLFCIYTCKSIVETSLHLKFRHVQKWAEDEVMCGIYTCK